MVILYSTNCPACKVLEGKLKKANIEFQVSNDINKIVEMGFMAAPVLQVNDSTFLELSKALAWVKENENVD